MRRVGGSSSDRDGSVARSSWHASIGQLLARVEVVGVTIVWRQKFGDDGGWLMASVRQGSWWEIFVRRLARESVTTLAPEFDSSIAELEKALSLADAGGSALDAPWWPEAVRRIQAGVSLRDTARSFGTNPRRLRRALARAGIRVGGANLGASGLPALAAFRDRLGQEPDTAIAAQAGVSTLAVQGERRRLGLSAFRPKGRVRQSPPPPALPPQREAPAPARPLRPRGRFSGSDVAPADLQIIRRPGSARGGRSLPTAQAPAADAPHRRPTARGTSAACRCWLPRRLGCPSRPLPIALIRRIVAPPRNRPNLPRWPRPSRRAAPPPRRAPPRRGALDGTGAGGCGATH